MHVRVLGAAAAAPGGLTRYETEVDDPVEPNSVIPGSVKETLTPEPGGQKVRGDPLAIVDRIVELQREYAEMWHAQGLGPKPLAGC